MRAFIAIIVKDLRVRFSSPMELVFFLLLPVVFTVVLAGSSLGGTSRGAALPVVLVRDTAGTGPSRAFVAMLGTMPGIHLREVTDPTVLINTAVPDLLVSVAPSAAATASLPFTVTFRLSPWRGSAGATAQEVGAWLRTAGGARGATEAAAPAAVVAPAAQAPATRPAAAASAEPPTVSAPSGAATGNAGQIITWSLVPLLGLGAGFIAERRKGTMRRVLATPAPRALVSAASVAAETLGALVQVAILAVFGAAVFGLPWFGHPVELLALSAAFCVAGAALGTLLGALCSTSRQAGQLGLALALVLAVLGGCWYPAALFPASLRTVAHLDPAGWAMDGFLSVLSPAANAGPALHSAVLLLGLAAAAFLLAAVATRARRTPAA